MKYFSVTDDGIIVDLDEEVAHVVATCGFPHSKVKVMGNVIVVKKRGKIVVYDLNTKKTFTLEHDSEWTPVVDVWDVYNNLVLYSWDQPHLESLNTLDLTTGKITCLGCDVEEVFQAGFVDNHHVYVRNGTGREIIYNCTDRVSEPINQSTDDDVIALMTIACSVISWHPCLEKRVITNKTFQKFVKRNNRSNDRCLDNEYDYQQSPNKQLLAFRNRTNQIFEVIDVQGEGIHVPYDGPTTQKGMLN